MNIAIVYKSVTGNTKIIADKIKEKLGDNVKYFGEPKEGIEAELYFVGSWTDKGMCCKEIENFMKSLENKQIIYFGTAGFGDSKEYYEMLFNRITQKDIHDMELILAKCSISDGIRVQLEDEIAFHSRIYQIVGNKMMMDLQQLLIPMYRYIHDNYIEFSKYNGRIDTKHFATHYDLLLALKSRNKVIYEQIIQRHLMAYQMYVEEHRDN